jgi:hypothetical protein
MISIKYYTIFSVTISGDLFYQKNLWNLKRYYLLILLLDGRNKINNICSERVPDLPIKGPVYSIISHRTILVGIGQKNLSLKYCFFF